MNKITPLYKGLITSLAMLAVTIILDLTNYTAQSGFKYLIYGLYAGGIGWTIYGFYKSPGFVDKFTNIFGQGFKCFIVITLVMVIATGVNSKMHPEWAEQSTAYYKLELMKDKSKLPAEIESDAAAYKKAYTVSLLSTAIFGYLFIGALFTAGGAALLLMRRK
ncbi:MAG TPA: hypothetical protein VK644_05500 [Chitinophagaceae bacterium]|nr:hypothetical protein [Chitinophagaceae bacterium]